MLSLLLLAKPLDAKAAGYGFYAGIGGGSAPSGNRLFNYHLNIGYDAFSIKNKETGGAASYKGVVINNDFGFGLLISPDNRLWIGPEVRVVFSPSGDHRHSGTSPNTNTSLLGLGGGPVIGFNHNNGDNSAFVFKIGYVSTTYGTSGAILYSPEEFKEKAC
jgi:hypothetical protein